MAAGMRGTNREPDPLVSALTEELKKFDRTPAVADGSGPTLAHGESDPGGFDTLVPVNPTLDEIEASIETQAAWDAVQVLDQEMMAEEARAQQASPAVLAAIRNLNEEQYAAILGARNVDTEHIRDGAPVTMADETVTYTERDGSEATGSYLIQDISREDSKVWTTVWDRSPDGIVRGTSRMQRSQVERKFRAGSHSPKPIGKVLPKPDVRCTLTGLNGMECGRKVRSKDARGRPVDELTAHQKAKHPEQLLRNREVRQDNAQSAAVAANERAAEASREAAAASRETASMMRELVLLLTQRNAPVTPEPAMAE